MDAALAALLSIAFHGIAYAMVLYLISVGLSITMGLMGFVNLAHGAFAMAGGYLVVTAMQTWRIPFPLALLIAFVVVGLASILFERTLYARFYRATELDQVLLTIGLAFMAIATYSYFYSPIPQLIQVPDYLAGQIDIGFRSVPTYRAFMIVVGLVMIALLWWGFERTSIGAQIRAAVDNRRMAESVGINVDRLFTLTFALGGGLAAPFFGITPSFATIYLIFFLIVVAVGGLGSLKGTLVAAVVLGVIDTAGKYIYAGGG